MQLEPYVIELSLCTELQQLRNKDIDDFGVDCCDPFMVRRYSDQHVCPYCQIYGGRGDLESSADLSCNYHGGLDISHVPCV